MFANFTEETCTGTGNTIELSGATSNRIKFNESFSNGDLISYVIEDSGGVIVVGGIGTYVSATDDITRNDTWNWNGTVVDESPASNITLSGGTHIIRCDVIASDITNMQGLTTAISSTADATAITINSSNNVGIGTPSPSARLNVQVVDGGSVIFEPSTHGVGNGSTAVELKLMGADNETDRYVSIACENGVASNINNMVFYTTNGGVTNEVLRLDSSGNATFAGNISLADNKHIYAGNDNNLDLYHNGTNSIINNFTGDLEIRGRDNSKLIQLTSFNSSGVEKVGVKVGGVVPVVELYGNGSLILSTTPTNGTINFANIPTSASGLSSGDVWSNAGVLTVV